MSLWFIWPLVLLVLVILLVIIGVVLCLYLTINDDFEAQPCPLTVIVHSTTRSKTPPPKEPTPPPEEMTSPPEEMTSLQRPQAMMAPPRPSTIIRVFERIAYFIKSNRAEVNAGGSYGSFAPANIEDPYKFSGWSSPPARHSFTVTIYNRLGQRIVQFEYHLQFVHSGSLYANELYLDDHALIPSFVSVRWGFKFNVHVYRSSVRNVGTPDHPIAAVTIHQDYCLIGLNSVQRTDSFEIRGDGTLNRLNQSLRPNR